MDEDAFGIVCNHKIGSKAIAQGAQVWLYIPSRGSGFERNFMTARSKGGRWIMIWIKNAKLENWRVKYIPPDLRNKTHKFPTRQAAQAYLNEMQALFRFDEALERFAVLWNLNE